MMIYDKWLMILAVSVLAVACNEKATEPRNGQLYYTCSLVSTATGAEGVFYIEDPGEEVRAVLEYTDESRSNYEIRIDGASFENDSGKEIHDWIKYTSADGMGEGRVSDFSDIGSKGQERIKTDSTGAKTIRTVTGAGMRTDKMVPFRTGKSWSGGAEYNMTDRTVWFDLDEWGDMDYTTTELELIYDIEAKEMKVVHVNHTVLINLEVLLEEFGV